nr:N-acetyllactosaminide beta-1,6-N-acetylglucosaminyl-transferase-like [Anas platyrhynchos]
MNTLRYCFFTILILSVSLLFVFYAINFHVQKSLRRLNFPVSSTLAEACKALIEDKAPFLKETALKTSFRKSNCTEYITRNHYITRALSSEEAAFPLAYIITLHKEFETFERLFRAVYMPQNVYCVHVDGKAPVALRQAVWQLVGCFPNAFLASHTERVVYGGASRLRADLHCMRDLLASTVPWQVRAERLRAGLPLEDQPGDCPAAEGLQGKECHPWGAAATPRHRSHQAPPPHNLTIYFGSAYIAVTRPFVKFVLQDRRAIDLLAWSQDTYSPDEHFWVTLNRIPEDENKEQFPHKKCSFLFHVFPDITRVTKVAI